jgi:hypothetical protein
MAYQDSVTEKQRLVAVWKTLRIVERAPRRAVSKFIDAQTEHLVANGLDYVSGTGDDGKRSPAEMRQDIQKWVLRNGYGNEPVEAEEDPF